MVFRNTVIRMESHTYDMPSRGNIRARDACELNTCRQQKQSSTSRQAGRKIERDRGRQTVRDRQAGRAEAAVFHKEGVQNTSRQQKQSDTRDSSRQRSSGNQQCPAGAAEAAAAEQQ